MNIRDCKIGDIAVFRDGTEAKIVNYKYKSNGQCLLWFDRRVKGWISGYMDNYWVYLENGKVITTHINGNDIIKIVRS